MNFIKSVEETMLFDVNGKTYLSNKLPEEIGQQINVLDEIRSELAEVSYKQHVLMMALEYKKNHIKKMIEDMEKAKITPAKNKNSKNDIKTDKETKDK